VFGFLGLALRRFGYSAPTIVLGAILGPIIERNLRLSLILSNNNPVTFVTHPISLCLLLGALAIVSVVVITKRRSRGAKTLLTAAEGLDAAEAEGRSSVSDDDGSNQAAATGDGHTEPVRVAVGAREHDDHSLFSETSTRSSREGGSQ
jgi:hypothetical protein